MPRLELHSQKNLLPDVAVEVLGRIKSASRRSPAKLSLHQVESVIRRARPEEQRVFLMHLPQLLKLAPEDIRFLKAVESSFEFWNNSDDAIYDNGVQSYS